MGYFFIGIGEAFDKTKSFLFPRDCFTVNTKLRLALLVAFCLLLNLGGKALARNMELPLWLDAFGTILGAYALGPVCGGMIGLGTNILANLANPPYMVYGTTNLIIGVAFGLLAQKKYMEDIFHSMVAAGILTAVAVMISTPLNLLYNGMTGNLWGDGVILFLLGHSFPSPLASCIGEFYVDFLDKTLTLALLYYLIHKSRQLRQGSSAHQQTGLHTLCLLLPALLLPALLLPALPGFTSSGQNTAGYNYNRLMQTVYDTEHGLPSNELTDITQTKDGILWLGTDEGLYRFNGTSFQLITDVPSVKNVSSLYVDDEGRLLVGTRDSGLTIFINQQVSNIMTKKNGLTSDTINCIVQSANGDYYLGTSNYLNIVTITGGLKTKDYIAEIRNAQGLTADTMGNVAAVTKDGQLFLLQGGRIQQQLTAPAGEQYTCCSFDAKNRLYAGTSGNQVVEFQLQDNQFQQTATYSCPGLQHLTRLYLTEQQQFICGENGFGYWDVGHNFHLVNTPGFQKGIDDILVDYQGNVWLSSNRQGLLRLCSSVFEDVFLTAGLPEAAINALDKWQGNLYLATDTGLLCLTEDSYSPVSNQLTAQLSGQQLTRLQHDQRGNLWLSTLQQGLYKAAADGSLTRFDTSNGLPGKELWDMLPMENGEVAVATEEGISFISGQDISTPVSSNDLNHAHVVSMLETSDSSLLVGTEDYGIFLIRNHKVAGRISHIDGINLESVRRLVPDPVDGGIFILTSNRLCYQQSDYSVTSLDNIPSYNNFDIIPGPQEQLYLLNSSGVYCLNRNKLLRGEKDASPYFDRKAGMPYRLTPGGQSYIDDHGSLYLAGTKGAIRLTYNGYYNTFRSFRMIVSGVNTDQTYLPMGRDRIAHIGSGVNRIEILPEILNYSLQDPYISYYLEGIDEQPAICRQSELTGAVYTNLPAGEYRFHLSVLDEDKRSILETTTYTISKAMEIYDHLWFKLYMLLELMLFVACVAWFIARVRINQTVLKQQLTLKLMQRQLDMADQTIQTIVRTVDAKDADTGQHSARVSRYSLLLGQALGLSEEECANLAKAALLHDIGKIGITDAILNKPARLTDEEYNIMKSHTEKGAVILKDFTLVNNIIDGAHYHHERYDGFGYPKGLQGEEIPLFARIIAVADTFDAMTANRVYRQSLDKEYVVNELRRCSNTQLDGKLVALMLELIQGKVIDMDHLHEDDWQESDQNKSELQPETERGAEQP